MFDMGFTELVLIGIVALIVIGPERLPAVARTAGKYFGKLRRFMSDVKSDVESELRADELRDIFNKQQEELQSLKKVVDDVGADVSESVNEIGQSIDTGIVDNTGEDSAAEPDESQQAAAAHQNSWTEAISEPQSESSAETKPKSKAKTSRAKSPKAKSSSAKKSSAKSSATKSSKTKTAKVKSKAKKVAAK